MNWKTLLPPVAIPLVMTLAIGLAGPNGALELTQHRVDPPGVVRPDPEAVGRRGLQTPVAVGPGLSDTPSMTRASPVSSGTTPALEPTAAPSGAPSSVPTPPVPPPPLPTPPPSGEPIPPPGSPFLLEAQVNAMVRDYTIAAMATVTVAFDWCSAAWLGTAWGAACQIVDPACDPFTLLGVPCAYPSLTLSFYLYEGDLSIVPADVITRQILDSY